MVASQLLSKTLFVIFALICLIAYSVNTTYARKARAVIPKHEEAVFLLVQRSSSLGKQITYVSPGYLRLESKRLGCTILVRPPGTTLDIVNDGKRTYFDADVANWRDKGAKGTSDLEAKYKNFLGGRALEQGTICGLVAYKYTKRTAKGAEVDYWLARDIAISSGTREILAKMLNNGVPIDRMPLRIVSRHGKKKKVYLDTDEYRRMTVDAGIFSRPSGYVRATNELDVMANFDESQLDGISSIIYKYNESGELPGKQELKNLKSNFLKNDR